VKALECIIFNVEHGFCACIKSPNGYGLLVDCGSRDRFSPIKWIRQQYNVNTPGFCYYQGRQYAECVITHLHADHFDDVGSFKDSGDKPKTLVRDKRTMKFLDEKIQEAKKRGDTECVKVLEQFKKFSGDYTEDVKQKPDWGFGFYERFQLPFDKAEAVNANRNKIINNRSNVLGISYAGKKILIPGDIEVEAWQEALKDKCLQRVVAKTTFFVASPHGHKSGFTSEILDHSGKPDLFIVSARSGDEDVDTSYSKAENSNGYVVAGRNCKSHMLSTREEKKTIRIRIKVDGSTEVSLIDTPDNLNENQARLRARKTHRAALSWGVR